MNRHSQLGLALTPVVALLGALGGLAAGFQAGVAGSDQVDMC
jgi:hypothetical protein